MKTLPKDIEQLSAPAHPSLKIDLGALCFFLLGMFLAAFIFHQFTLF
jgi:hypothetical protein